MFTRSSFIPLSLAAFLSFSLCGPAPAESLNPLQVINPRAGSEVIAKNLDIQARLTEQIDHDSLIILLDDNDITAMAEFTEAGFHCQIPMQLTGGTHSLYIAGNGPDGPFEKEITFNSKQNTTFDQATTSNEWSINMRAGNFHSNKSDDFTATNLDSTWQHESTLKKGNWQLSLSAGARLLEDNYSGASGAQNFFGGQQQNSYGPQEQSSSTMAQNQGSLDHLHTFGNDACCRIRI